MKCTECPFTQKCLRYILHHLSWLCTFFLVLHAVCLASISEFEKVEQKVGRVRKKRKIIIQMRNSELDMSKFGFLATYISSLYNSPETKPKMHQMHLINTIQLFLTTWTKRRISISFIGSLQQTNTIKPGLFHKFAIKTYRNALMCIRLKGAGGKR